MEVGSPVIGTKIGCIAEIIEHEVNGLLVPYGDTIALKEAMSRMLLNDDFRREMIQGGKQTLRSKFRVDIYRQKLEEIYNRSSRLND